MSFSSDVKEELCDVQERARHCNIAELLGLLCFGGSLVKSPEGIQVSFENVHESIQRKYFTLIKKTLSMSECNLPVLSMEDSRQLLEVLHIPAQSTEYTIDGILLQQTCCKKAFLRGAFLSAGSVSDPDKSYHFEIITHREDLAKVLSECMIALGLDAKEVPRKQYRVVYLKEGSQIVETLGLMGASRAYLSFENTRILKDMRNSVNRRVNCEAANIQKTVGAAVRQVEDIRLIEEKMGLSSLPDLLREMAEVRLQYPDMPLKDLGGMLNPPVGKSGTNHRLRKIGEIADALRAKEDRT